MVKTFKFRLKNTGVNHLSKMSDSVNFVWNYCNDVSVEYLDKHYKWLSGYNLDSLTGGCSKQLLINSKTVQLVCHEFATRRIQFKKRKLSWRSKKRSLGWIPFNEQSIKIKQGLAVYNKHKFRFWKSREIEGEIKCGSFNQDSKGNWYVNFVCEVPDLPKIKDNREVGIDLGLKTLATLSDGTKISRENLTNKYASKLAMAQRANKKKQVKNINAKMKNIRKDFNHKETTKLINSYGTIFVGDVSPSKLRKTQMSKSVSDAAWGSFKSMLAYKAIALGVEYKEVKETFSTVTCSTCFERSGPSGLSALGVREWQCSKCGTIHDRDVNAAKNILRFGHESPIKGSLILEKMSILARKNKILCQ